MRLAPLDFRRRLRRDSTDAEVVLWNLLRGRRLAGFKFRRQHPVGIYVLDFYCPAVRLAVEADGGQHFTPDGLRHDQVRTGFLAARQIHILRFTDNQILTQRQDVLHALWLRLTAGPSPHPSPR